MSESHDSIEVADESRDEPEHEEAALWWDSDAANYEGTKIVFKPMRNPVDGFEGRYRVDFVDYVRGKGFGHYGPIVIEE